jgi:hypothetical protein
MKKSTKKLSSSVAFEELVNMGTSGSCKLFWENTSGFQNLVKIGFELENIRYLRYNLVNKDNFAFECK